MAPSGRVPREGERQVRLEAELSHGTGVLRFCDEPVKAARPGGEECQVAEFCPGVSCQEITDERCRRAKVVQSEACAPGFSRADQRDRFIPHGCIHHRRQVRQRSGHNHATPGKCTQGRRPVGRVEQPARSRQREGCGLDRRVAIVKVVRRETAYLAEQHPLLRRPTDPGLFEVVRDHQVCHAPREQRRDRGRRAQAVDDDVAVRPNQ